MKALRAIYKWSTFTAERSWRSHAILSIVWIAAIAGVAWSTGNDGLQAAAYASIVSALFFRVKEIFDALKHRRKGSWNKPQWDDRVTPKVDEKGDLLGAYTCLWVLWSLLAVRKFGHWIGGIL